MATSMSRATPVGISYLRCCSGHSPTERALGTLSFQCRLMPKNSIISESISPQHVAIFVVRAKTNVRFKPETWKRRLPGNVVSDAVGYFTIYKSSKDYPEKLRKVVCIDPEDDTRYIFLTNNLSASAETIAELYRNRWSVELFFKWIKQHLRIKKFWGTSENAVRIQIYCAIITYCLVAIVQHDMKLERSIYEVLQILGISLTDKTHLRDLFDKSNFKNVNDLYDSSEPNLFNF